MEKFGLGRLSWVSSLSVFVVLASGCAVEGASESFDSTEASSAEQGLLADNVVSLTELDTANATILADGIAFPTPSAAVRAVKSGDVLSTAGSKRAFIRKVKSVVTDGQGGITIKT